MYQELERFGLSPEETKYYILLINHKALTIDEVRSQTQNPKKAIEKALDSLERLGLIRSDEKRPKKYFSIDPNEGLENLENRKMAELEEARKNLVDLLRPQYFQQGQHFKELTGRIVTDEALRVFNDLLDNAHSEIILKNINSELLNQVLHGLYSAKKRGVTIRFAIVGQNLSYEQFKKISDFDLRTYQNGKNKYEINGRMYLKSTAIIDSALLVTLYFHTLEDIWLEMSRREDCALCEGKMCRVADPFRPIHGPGAPPKENDREKVLSALQEHLELPKRKLSKVTGLSGGLVAQVVEELARDGIVKVRKETTGGRPREIVFIR